MAISQTQAEGDDGDELPDYENDDLSKEELIKLYREADDLQSQAPTEAEAKHMARHAMRIRELAIEKGAETPL